ncbi:MAG: YwiC-like family protein [Bacteroidetes bacterium]|nr:YwiC-like family protein [Bacteroidota bacterium]
MKIPREYGAWAMVLGPFVLGVAVAGRVHWANPLLLMAISALFVAKYPLAVLWQARGAADRRSPALAAPLLWLGGCAVAAIGAGLPLVLLAGYWWLAFVGALAALLLVTQVYLEGLRQKRALASELLAVAGGALAAPSAYLVTGGGNTGVALGLWLLAFLYWGNSIFYVRMKVQERLLPAGMRTWAERWKLGRGAMLYLTAALILTGVAGWTGYTSPLAIIAFVPTLLRLGRDMLSPSPERNIRRLGRRMIGYTVAFVALAAIAYHL